MQSFLTSVLETHPKVSSKSAIAINFFIFLITNMLVLQEVQPEAPGCILGHFSLAANNDNYIKNGINRRHSGTTDKEWLFRKLQRKRALQADNPKKLSFSVEISLITFYIILFFETTKCHFLVVQVIFVKRSDGQLAGRDKVILNISHASRVPDNRIRSSLLNIKIYFLGSQLRKHFLLYLYSIRWLGYTLLLIVGLHLQFLDF